jgi:hypothetical protein
MQVHRKIQESLVDMAKPLVARRRGPDRNLYENGALLPGPEATLAGPMFEEWLDSRS